MKFCLLSIALVFSARLSGGPQVPKDNQPASDTSAQQRRKADKVIPPTHVVIDQPYPTISTKPEGPKEQNKPEEPLPWFVQFTKPEWVIVYVTAVYAFIAGWTLIAIKDQANSLKQQVEDARKTNAETATTASNTLKAIQRQAELMEASMTQWVSVANWRANLVPPYPILRVEFEVTNESNFPLIMGGTFRFFGQQDNGAMVHMGRLSLFPRKPYNFRIDLHPTENHWKEYVADGLRIAVHGQIVHIGVAEKQSPLMEIRGNLVCRSNQATYLEFESINLIPTNPKDEQPES